MVRCMRSQIKREKTEQIKGMANVTVVHNSCANS